MIFRNSSLILKHLASGTKIHFNAFDALIGWKQEALPPVEVPAAAKWKFRRFFPVTHVQLSIPGNSRHQIGRMLAVDALLGAVLGLCCCVSVQQGVLAFVFIVLLAGSVSVRACREFLSLSGPVGSF
ncbi:uncharacterized protein LOC110685192 isoform X1 [Chenopodium quinoa]|uniref:uncharacterized protein LOC110685190 isoform X1 n=1 Tax=Chenopodium quinoa TaxID=63459 RepID=UPI000B793AB5|nr:uncharacterized protein LOC110685190 isoform X1 [Chenopodium quinoa]XP_021717363.1 uncharacterized protein LOC110685192 isoform X1 [Chenopodium quinoa]